MYVEVCTYVRLLLSAANVRKRQFNGNHLHEQCFDTSSSSLFRANPRQLGDPKHRTQKKKKKNVIHAALLVTHKNCSEAHTHTSRVCSTREVVDKAPKRSTGSVLCYAASHTLSEGNYSSTM